jgi:hypothetical protein
MFYELISEADIGINMLQKDYIEIYLSSLIIKHQQMHYYMLCLF